MFPFINPEKEVRRGVGGNDVICGAVFECLKE
jgi:hypothetical protein